MLEAVLSEYEISSSASIESFGSGLIHRTWKINDGSGTYILQKINHQVFQQPDLIAANIQAIASWLKKTNPEYFFVAPVATHSGAAFVHNPDGYYRMFVFVAQSFTHDTAQTPQQAFEAAKQFGSFTRVLKQFPAKELHITLPDFHNLSYRYEQFENAVRTGIPSRLKEADRMIQLLQHRSDIVTTYNEILQNPDFRIRVTHHDTKINNVLFDKNDRGICVIDLDTVMPGYFISDVGDMMRTYLSPVSEEEKDFEKIRLRENFFYAIARGYLEEMADELTPAEIKHFVYSGMFMTYMQALRFLTDYLDNDVYYGSAYPGHNFTRAKNQATLLERITEKRNELEKMVMRINPR